MSARLSPFHDHVADQVMAALADAWPGPLSTPDIQVATGYGIRHGQLVSGPGTIRPGISSKH